MTARSRIFFATDIHGSDVCFRKFINAAKTYGASALILGGDITGKGLVPVIRQAGIPRFVAHWNGETVSASEADLLDLEDRVRFSGFYPIRMTKEDAELLSQSPAALDDAFQAAAGESIQRWITFAEDRLDPKVECYVSPGNDDAVVVSEFLSRSRVIINPDQRLVRVLGQFEMLSLGFSNLTPFHTPRELPEADFAKMIDGLATNICEPDSAIFNIHCPPYNSGIDTAVELDDHQQVVSRNGQPIPSPIGSTAVRNAILRYQPMLGLHGHVHESRGVARLGRTICINPGSRYGEGTLNGVLLTMELGRLANYQFVSA
jgi:Icc-related predicted phosphoesterase